MKLRLIDYKFLPEVLIYIKEFIFTVKWLILTNKKFDLYIGMDGLCTFFWVIFTKV